MKWRVLISVLFLALHAFADKPEDYIHEPPYFTFPGKTIEEKKVRWVWLNLPAMLATCFYSKQCGLTDDEKKLIGQMYNNGQKTYNDNTIQFVSEKEKPGTFTSGKGEVHRIAVTGNDPSSPILINSDRLTKDGKSLGLPFWMGILTHEIVHHQGIEDDTKRIPDQIGAKMAAVFEKALVQVNVPEGKDDVQVYVVNFPLPSTTEFMKKFPTGIAVRALTVDRENIYNFSSLEAVFKQADQCQGALALASNVVFQNLHVNPHPDKPENLKVALSYDATVVCYNPKTGESGVISVPYIYWFELKKQRDGSLLFDRMGNIVFAAHPKDRDSSIGTAEESKILELNSPASAQAGQDLVVAAKMKAPKGKKIVNCGGVWGADEWPHFDTGLPYGVENHACELKSLGDDVYEIRVHRKISANTPPMKLELQRLCLSEGDPDVQGCYFGFPAKRTYTSVVNAHPGPASSMTVEIKRARLLKTPPEFTRYYIYSGAKTFDLELTVKNAIQVEQAFFTGNFFNMKDEQISFGGPLMTADKSIVKNARQERRGNDVVITFEIQLPMEVNQMRLKGLKFSTFNLLTSDLQLATVNLAWRDLAIFFEEAIPAEGAK